MGVALSAGLKPPERITVTEAATRYVQLNIPGAYVGPYNPDLTPYMTEPADMLASRSHDSVVFVGPAQSGKTQSLILNWLAYNIMTDPMDMIIYNPSHAAARDFAVRRVDRMHRHSPQIGAMMSPRADDDNRHDKLYKNGALVTLSWPSVTEFAGKPIGRAALTDYDRMADDIDGDGSPFDLASKRTTTFGSFAMTLAESSPSRPLEDPRWIAETPHQAPPVTGILSLYNRGDRRRWYWPCMGCGNYFEGNFRMMKWADSPDRVEASESCFMECPTCGHHNLPHDRKEMNAAGAWLKDGQSLDARKRIVGQPHRSKIASFWLNGVAASFISWPKMVLNFLAAEDEYRRTSSEDALKKFYNTDLAEPYTPKNLADVRTPETLKDRAEPYGQAGEPAVPESVRTLVAAIDVQTNKFVVQVFGIAPGNPFDVYVIDRFDVVKSARLDADGERLWVKPGTYLEDWNLLIQAALLREYPVVNEPGARMGIKITICDSGGREGVTTNAYAFYRLLRREGLHDRFHLVKGEPSPLAPRAQVRYPDSSTRASGSRAGAQGDIPVLFINSTLVKDTLNNRLDSTETGKGRIHFPVWFSDEFFAEMCSEVRTPKGWERAKGGRSRNEAWDLSYYLLGLCASPVLNVERLDWTGKVPAWAETHDRNPLVTKPAKEDVAPQEAPRYKIARLASVLG